MQMKLRGIAYHRNGMQGEPFHAVAFTYRDGGSANAMVATVFDVDDEDTRRIAILDANLASIGNVTFSENSWRFETFEEQIKLWIKAFRQIWENPTRVSKLPPTADEVTAFLYGAVQGQPVQ